MKKILSILIGVSLLFSLAFANDTSLGYGEFGKTVSPINNNNIRMISENIDVYVNSTGPMDDDAINLVNCTFVFQNTSDQPETVLMGFPGEIIEYDAPDAAEPCYSNSIENFTTQIKGTNIDVKKINATEENPYSYWYTWELTFEPGETITVQNSYNVIWDYYADTSPSNSISFGYIITTGKEWKDTIGETTVNFHINPNISYIKLTPGMSDEMLKHITTSGNIITFNRKNFEPAEDLRFTLKYNDSLFFEYIKTISINPGHQAKANKELEQVSPVSDSTKAKVSTGTNGESELNLKISKALKENIANTSQLTTINLIRESQNIDISNKERALLMNNSDIAISIHCNGSDNKSISGTELLIPSKENLYNKEVYEKSKELANNIKNNLESMYLFTNKSPKSVKIIERNDLTTLNWSDVPTVMIECGYLTNEHDKAFINELTNPNSNIANQFFYAIADAIDRSSKIEKKTLTQYLASQNNAPAVEVIATSIPEDATITETIPQKQFPLVPVIIGIVVIVIIGIIIVVILRKKKNTVEENIENDNK